MQDKFDNPVNLLMNLLSAGEITEAEAYYQQVLLNAEKFKPGLFRQFYSIEDEGKQKSFIRNFHARLVVCTNSLFDSIEQKKKENPEKYRDLIRAEMSIFHIVKDLLAFIWDNFSSWCDKDQKMTNNSQIILTRELSERLESLKLSENSSDHVLYEKVKVSIDKRLNSNQPGITYGFISYLNEFIREIEMTRESNLVNSFPITLKDVIIVFNFNSLAVIHYWVSVYVEELKLVESAKDKIELLNCWLKKVNQVPVKPDHAFDPKHIPVNQFLNNWIQEEIRYYEKGLLLFSGNYPMVYGHAPVKFKFEIDLSVSQIACCVRLLMECKVLKNSNIREVLNFLAEHAQSKRKENISAESLRLKYYNVEETTREEVRKVIFRLLKRINLSM